MRLQDFLSIAVASLLLLVAGGCRAPVVPTTTPTPVPTQSPNTHYPLPTTTPALTAASTPAPAPTPTRTPAATRTPTPVPTQSPDTQYPIPTATPVPTAAVIIKARQAMALGDYFDAAVSLKNFTIIHASHPQVDEARFLQAQALIRLEQTWQAIPLLETLVQDESARARFPEALFWLARAIDEDDDSRAAALFEQYAGLSPHLQPEISILAGESWARAQNLDASDIALQQAAENATSLKAKFRALEDLAANAVTRGDLKTAERYNRQILHQAQIPGYRAEIFYNLAQVQYAANHVEDAWDSEQQAIREDISSWYAYLALVDLVNHDVPVDTRLRARIDIEAGATTPAIELLHALLATDPADAGDLYILLARACEIDKNYAAAADAWRQAMLHSQDDDVLQQAWLGLGRSLWRQGQQEQARIAYLQGAEQMQDEDAAATALWWAAVLAGRDEEKWQQAADDFMRLARTWPEHEYADQARFRAGLINYRLGEYDTAQSLWQEFEPDGVGEWQAAAHFWLGKLQKAQGDDAAARAWWQQTARQWDANTFYGLRARQEISTTLSTQATPPPHSDTPEAARRWVAALADEEFSAGVTLPELARIAEWHRLGEDGRGHSELEALRQSWADDAIKLWRVTLFARDTGYFDISIRAATRLVVLSDKPLTAAPLYIQKLVYPRYYQPLLSPAAKNRQLDPALFYGLIRQESLFWAPATSSAGAMGLAQIMPATGEAAARQTRLEAATLDDLSKPRVNLYLGAYIFSQELERSQGNVFRALAAYNAGPGNADFWWQLAEQDSDLFVELISFRETQHYVRTITVQAQNYRRLYPDLQTP